MQLNRNSEFQRTENTIENPPYVLSDPAKTKTYSAVIKYLSIQIVKELFLHRRLLPGEESICECFNEEASYHMNSISHCIDNGERLTFILPGFPAKSPNRQKTLGALPDLAEKAALESLANICQRIEKIYTPGAEIVICSDGRLFSDVERIPEKDVTEYSNALKKYTHGKYHKHLKFFCLEDVFSKEYDFDTMREELLVRYGESIQSLRARCKKDKTLEENYKGITRFMLEDYSILEEFKEFSRSFVQKQAKTSAYRLIQRSEAWSRLLESRFDRAVRLSVHPQFRVSKKIGIQLVDTRDYWLTPWHSVAVRNGGKIKLMKRSEAEKVGLLAFEQGRPSHFEILPSQEGQVFKNGWAL